VAERGEEVQVAAKEKETSGMEAAEESHSWDDTDRRITSRLAGGERS